MKYILKSLETKRETMAGGNIAVQRTASGGYMRYGTCNIGRNEGNEYTHLCYLSVKSYTPRLLCDRNKFGSHPTFVTCPDSLASDYLNSLLSPS